MGVGLVRCIYSYIHTLEIKEQECTTFCKYFLRSNLGVGVYSHHCSGEDLLNSVFSSFSAQCS